VSRRRLFAALVPIAVGVVVAVFFGTHRDAGAGAFTAAKDGPGEEIKHDKSPPLWTIPPKKGPKKVKLRPEHRFPHSTGTVTSEAPVTSSTLAAAAPTVGTGFQGVNVDDSSGPGVPSDDNAAVGPNHIVQVTNTAFEVFSKTGTSLYGPADTNTIWSGFDPGGPGAACDTENDGDATVAYDRAADRFVIQQFSLEPYFLGTGEYLECIAVSATNDPTGSWYRYAFDGFGDEFPDYPKLGVWPDGYYTTYNLFGGGDLFDGTEVCAYERAQMLQDHAARQVCQTIPSQTLNGLLPADVDSSTPPAAGAPEQLIGMNVPTSGNPTLKLYTYAVDWTATPHPTGSLSSATTFTPSQAILIPCDALGCETIKQPGSGGSSAVNPKLDSLGDRLMYRYAYRNFGTYESFLVTQTVKGSSTVNRTGIRWYEFRKNPSAGGTPTVFQQGTFFPSSDTLWRWMPSAAMNQDGDIALGYSATDATTNPGVRVTGHLAGDSATTYQGETTLKSGSGAQTTYGRWGDYSSMQVDPNDDCTFWYTTQYLPNTDVFNWRTWIGSFQLPGCGSGGGGGGGGGGADDFSISASPTSVSIARGSSGKTFLNTAITSGSAQSIDLATSLPSNVKGTFTIDPVTAGTQSKLKMSVGLSAKKGTYTITVTGTATSGAHSTTFSLKIT
jgi:hypothetical protein